jgi:hypothetical protein
MAQTSRYAIITPAGVIRFWIVPETKEIVYLNKDDAKSKINSKWDLAGDKLKESCTITDLHPTGLWFHIELSDPYYGCPMYYIWDTQASESINANILEIETKFVQNLV